MNILGIDIGGSGIKGAPVNPANGELAAEPHLLPTPRPALPDPVAEAVGRLARHFNWASPIGCTFPAVIKNGVAWSAANVDRSWIGTDARRLFERATGCPVRVINDADAAGIAEMTWGAGKGRQGVVILLTFGTGIGSAVFTDGSLVPNTEFGHMQIRGRDAEHRASARIRTEKNLGWKKWIQRVNEFLARMEALFSPDLFIFGGGVSMRWDRFSGYLETQAEVVPARFFNHAGIIGAAQAASESKPYIFRTTELSRK